MKTEIMSEQGSVFLNKGQETVVTGPTGNEVKVFCFGTGTWVGTKFEKLFGQKGKVVVKGSGFGLHKADSFVEMRQESGPLFLIVKHI